jgi:hypothetical protein
LTESKELGDGDPRAANNRKGTIASEGHILAVPYLRLISSWAVASTDVARHARELRGVLTLNRILEPHVGS